VSDSQGTTKLARPRSPQRVMSTEPASGKVRSAWRWSGGALQRCEPMKRVKHFLKNEINFPS
jgi:hypothetical protein